MNEKSIFEFFDKLESSVDKFFENNRPLQGKIYAVIAGLLGYLSNFNIKQSKSCLKSFKQKPDSFAAS